MALKSELSSQNSKRCIAFPFLGQPVHKYWMYQSSITSQELFQVLGVLSKGDRRPRLLGHPFEMLPMQFEVKVKSLSPILLFAKPPDH